MNLKLVVMASLATLLMGACAHHHGHHGCDKCASQKAEKKEGCASGECAMGKECADCKKTDGK
ncbi:MAG: hypothetical protein HUU57_13450 [Bdellovibrio sp.]|nr:hypothetical protein [Bdellovibrio sp.]